MTISMYQASVPVFVRGLTNMNGIFTKATAYATAHKIEPSVLLQSRLFPTMFTFTRQIQIAADFAKGTAGRLAGAELPKYDDTETTFAELNARLEKTIAYVNSFKAEQIDGSETREIVLSVGGQSLKMDGVTYLLKFSIPNFYFHLTTAYGLLRQAGLEIGKGDFIGPI